MCNRLVDVRCEACGHTETDVWRGYQQYGTCECGTEMSRWYRVSSAGVVDDSIPGGLLVAHGICNEDGTPRRYYSKSEMAAEAKRRGLTNVVEHVTARGTDKNKFTSRWV